jgi:hypothetical protein
MVGRLGNRSSMGTDVLQLEAMPVNGLFERTEWQQTVESPYGSYRTSCAVEQRVQGVINN